MPLASRETVQVEHEPTVADRVADIVRRAAHLSHEARLVKSMARDAGEEGVHAAKRAIRQVQRSVEKLEDFRDETAHYVKRQPLKAVGMAAGAGLVFGIVVGWIGATLGYRDSDRI